MNAPVLPLAKWPSSNAIASGWLASGLFGITLGLSHLLLPVGSLSIPVNFIDS